VAATLAVRPARPSQQQVRWRRHCATQSPGNGAAGIVVCVDAALMDVAATFL